MMKAEEGRDMAVLRDARKSTWYPERKRTLTQADMAKKIGKSVPTIVEIEKRPDQVPLSTLRDYYNVVGDDARVWIKEFVDSFFVA